MHAVQVDRGEAGAGPASGRIAGYDLARSLALLGMFVVHFGLVMARDHEQPAWASAILEALDGRAAATFVVLAGVGLALRSRRATSGADPGAISGVRSTLIRRGLFLLVVGFANLAIWPGDILRVYGVSLMVAAWFVDAPGRRLLTMAAGFVLGFIALLAALDYGKNWEWETMTYHRLWTPEGLARNLFYDGFRSVFPWTGFLFYGIWLGRLDLRNRAVNTRVTLAALGAALFAEIASRLCLGYFLAHPGAMDAEAITALFGTISMPPLPLFLLSAGGAATLVIALCVRLAESARDARWLAPFVDTGQMAFTWYFAHIVLGLGGVVALGLATSQPLPVGEATGLGFFAVALVVSRLWKSRSRHGPLEWVLRKLAG